MDKKGREESPALNMYSYHIDPWYPFRLACNLMVQIQKQIIGPTLTDSFAALGLKFPNYAIN